MPLTLDTSGNNSFAAAQVGDIYYGVNYWGVNLALNPNASGSWTIPCGPLISGNCYELPEEGSNEDTGTCTFCYVIPPEVDHGNGNVDPPGGSTSHVHAYPNMLFGTAGGGRETHGVACNSVPQLATSGRCNNNPVYDMNVPNSRIGLPVQVNNLQPLSYCFDINKDCSGDASNIENVFIDTYIHRIDKSALWPVGYQTGWGDLNKINGDATETWNLNFKLCLPEFSSGSDPGAAATGGLRINSTPITIDGRQWGIYFKWENLGQNNPRDATTGLPANGKCTNSFFYISFIPWSAATGVDRGICNATNVCINMDAFINWVGSQEFKDRVLGQNGFAPVAGNRQGSGNQTNWPLWVYQNVGSPPFIVDSPQSYVFDGIQLGNELWFSPNSQQSCICWSNVSFTTEKGTFGKFREADEPEPDQCTESNSVTAVVSSGSVTPSNEVTCVVGEVDEVTCACDPIVSVISEPEDCTDPIGEYTVLSVKGCDCCSLDIRQISGPYVPYTYDPAREVLTIGPYVNKGKAKFRIKCCKDSSDCKTSG